MSCFYSTYEAANMKLFYTTANGSGVKYLYFLNIGGNASYSAKNHKKNILNKRPNSNTLTHADDSND